MVGKGEFAKYGDGVSWNRGSMIGKGGFGCVYLATLKNPRSKFSYFPSLMAVKSAEVSASGSIQKEREILSNIKGCPYVIKCFGEETTMGENGTMVYNLLLEYGSGGNLSGRIQESGLPELQVRAFTRSILRGLKHVHGLGYVHCDLKPDNVLLIPDSRHGFIPKIGDFGLAKRSKQSSRKRKMEPYWRGTPMYLSPEAVLESIQEPPCDIWALGCIVLEMLTGKPPWEGNVDEILRKIGEGREVPAVPTGVSNETKGFLKSCFVRNSRFRWTAEMLLRHPFVEGLGDDCGVEPFEGVEDLDKDELIMLVSESDEEDEDDEDEDNCWSDEGDPYCFLSEDYTDTEEEFSSISGEVDKVSVIGARIGQSDENKSNGVSSPRYLVNYTVPAGV